MFRAVIAFQVSPPRGVGIAIERGWLWLHESGTYMKFTQAGADLFG
jgi:hypothetical protein